MPYTKQYILQAATDQGAPVSCLIWDTTSWSDDPDADLLSIALEGSGQPLTLSSIDNDENPFTSIKGQQLEISFHSTNQIGVQIFAEGEDNRWYVELIYGVDEHYIFKGFLVTDDLNEGFLCPPNIPTLTATDGLGLLKDIPLTDFEGNNPKGVFSLSTYIAWCLAKTGLELNINIIFSLRNQTGLHAFDSTFLDAKTFEDEIGTCVSCYEVLEQILGESSYLCMAFAEWWIVRVDEHRDDINVVFRCDHTGAATSSEEQDWTYQFNGDQPAFFAEESATVGFIRPMKSIKETFNYEYPKEIIDNIDFSRGQLLSPIIETVDDTDLRTIDQTVPGFDITNWSASAFNLEDWTTYGNSLLNLQPGSATKYIKRVFEYGYERSRYVLLKANGSFNWLRSNSVPVHLMDRITISIDTRSTVNTSAGDVLAYYQIVLYGTDGAEWIYGGLPNEAVEDYKWEMLDNTEVQNKGVFIRAVASEIDERDWRTISAEIQRLPASGDLYIFLPTAGTTGEIHYQNLKFDYFPFVNGGYNNYSGTYFNINRDGGYKAKIENEIYVADAPKRLFKGALLRQDVEGYQLTDLWRNNAEDAPGQGFRPFMWWQAYGVWNQYNRLMRSFEFQAQGIESNDLFPTLVHRYLIGDATVHTSFKKFMLLHFEMNIVDCEWSGKLVEVKDERLEKDYVTPIEQKYTEDR